MTPKILSRRRLATGALATLVLAGVAAALGVSLGTGGARTFRTQRAVAFPVPIYEIEAVSGSHHASLLNLPIGLIGAPQLPIPVDVDGDLLPDVEVAVNLMNAEGIFNNPPDLGQVIAPSVEINRLPTAPLLSQGTPPLRINVKLTIVDIGGNAPDTVVRFGYDTGLGGSIPPEFKAVLGGLADFFNPIDARIESTGGFLLGLNPGVPDLGLAPASNAYEGPLSMIAAVNSGQALNAAVDVRMSPLPDLIGLTYGSDAAGHHIALAHSHVGEVDVDVDGTLSTSALVEGHTVDTTMGIDARIDRLPSRVAIDFSGDDTTGSLHYAAEPAFARLPDARVELHSSTEIDGGAPQLLDAEVELESIPTDISGAWSLPKEELEDEEEEEQLVSLEFTGNGQGIGAIEARMSNYEGEPEAFTPFSPTKRQYASIQAGPGGLLEGETLLQARLERVRSAQLTETETGGLTGSVAVGDGELPLQLHGELDLRVADDPETPVVEPAGIALDATSTISPLPDLITFELLPPGKDQLVEPLRAGYTASEAVDIDLDARVALAGTPVEYECGDPDTFCADMQVHHIPASIEARVYQLKGETRIELDDVPRPGGAPVDVFVDALVGPISAIDVPDFGVLAAPMNAQLDLQGVPAHIRVRAVDGAAQTFERIEFHACDRDYDAQTCRLDEDGNSTDGEVADVAFRINNFDLRPANLPPPPATEEPVYVTVVGRGLPDTNDLVNFEATGRLTDISELQYINVGQLFGVRTDVAGAQNFRALVDIQDFDLDGDETAGGRVDFDADVKVTPLPTPADFCLVLPGRVLGDEPYDPITAPCENTNPFRGTAPITTSPLAFAYRSGESFDASVDVSLEGDLPFELPELPIGFEEFGRINAAVDLTNIPGDFTGYVDTPATGATTRPDGTVSNSTRVLTIAPGASNLSMDLTAEMASAGDDCSDADLDGSLICADVSVVGLPDYASALLDTVTEPGAGPDGGDALRGLGFEFHACDRDFVGGTGCRDDADGNPTLGEIGSVDVDARVHAGDPSGVPAYLPPAGIPHLVALADIESLDDLEAVASAHVSKIRSFTLEQGPDGIDATSDLGDGTLPLEVYANADLRDFDEDNLVPEALQAHIIGEIDLTPLPQTFTYHQAGPGANQSEPMTITVDNSARTDFAADVQIYEKGAGPACGDHGTTCAHIEIDDIPEHVGATIGKSVGPLNLNRRDSDTSVDLELRPTADPTNKPDVRVNAAVGLPADLPVVAEAPLFADVILTGAPRYVSVRLEAVETVSNGPGGLEVTASDIERLQFHTCQRNYLLDACLAGTEDKVDEVSLSARTFDLRPTNFPAPPALPDPLVGDEPLFLGVAGRGRNLEAVVRIPDISEVQFVNRDGVIAAKARVGGTSPSSSRPLNVRVDIEDLSLPGTTIPLVGVSVADPILDVIAAIDVVPFPGDASVCIRQPSRPLSGDSGALFAAVCDNDQPFGTLPADAISHSPLSLGFSASDAFTISADVDASIDGVNAANGAPIDPIRIIGTLDLADIPTTLEAHVYEPALVATPTGVHMTGPMRARVRMPGAVSGPDLTNFSVAYLTGDRAVCEDPRPTVSALCVSAEIIDLPTTLDLSYDPSLDLATGVPDPATASNLTVSTSTEPAGSSTDVNNLKFSSVKPKLNPNGTPVSPLASDVLIATAELDPFPNPFDLRGLLDLPDRPDDPPTAVFEVLNGDTLPKIVAHIQNYTAPDPTIGVEVPDRPVGDPANVLETDSVSVIQRGEALRVDATLSGLQAAGIKALFTANPDPTPAPGEPLFVPIGTTQLSVRFGQDKNVRAYLDLQPSAQDHTIADLLLENLPAAIDVCVRGPRSEALADADPVTGTATWCDSDEVTAGEGAVELFGQPAAAGRKIDIDGFIRLLSGGGAEVMAARFDVEDLPQVLRVTVPADPTADPGGALPNGAGESVHLVALSLDEDDELELTPDGIGRVEFQAASFDLPDAETGYAGTLPDDLPYVPIVVATGPFPAKAAAGGVEFIHAAAHIPNGDFHIRGRIGRTDGQPSSQLQEAIYGLHPCPAPVNGPPDYPFYPNDGSEYMCIKAQFAAGTDGVNPLSLHAEVDTGDGNFLKVRDAGLSDIPSWVQLTLAKSQPFLDPAHQRGWRRPCGPADIEPDDASCMPPMLRVDQPTNAYVFGVAEYGDPDDFDDTPENTREVDDIGVPAGQVAPDFDAAPTAGGWNASFAEGVRAKVIDYDGGTPTVFDDDRLAARAAFRLALPQSLTVDQFQSYNGEDAGSQTSATDYRFRVVIRDDEGEPVDNLGQVAALLHLADSNAQILLTKPCATNLAHRAATGPPTSCPAEHTQGMPLPGELGLTLFVREKTITDPIPDTDRTSTFLQVDGRVSTEIEAGIRLLGNGVELSPGIHLGYVEAALRGLPALTPALENQPHLPSFRVRAEIMSDKGTGPPGFPLHMRDITVGINSVSADIDLSPDNALPARRIDAVIYTDGGIKLSADIKGNSATAGNGVAAPVSINLAADIDPLDLLMRTPELVNFGDIEFGFVEWLDRLIGLPDWLQAVLEFIEDALEWFVQAIVDVVEAVINVIALEIEMESSIVLQLQVDELTHFELRANLLHLYANAEGPGSGTVGPINLDMDVFQAGVPFDLTIDVPGWIDWFPGVPDEIVINELLLGLEYDPNASLFNPIGGPPIDLRASTVLGENLLLDYRSCSNIGTQLLPFSGNIETLSLNSISLPGPFGNDLDFILWPLTDPRMQVSGILNELTYDTLGTFLDVVLDVFGNVFLCNIDALDVSDTTFGALDIDTATTDADAYNPGNSATNQFPGHPVPGQPNQPDELDPELNDPDLPGAPVPAPAPKPVSPGFGPAPTPPTAPAPLYSGPSPLIGTDIALCGIHEFSALTVNTRIDVADTADDTDTPWGSPDRCLAGYEGTLELRANNLVVGTDGEIVGDGISDAIPVDFAAAAADYNATGSSGGTNAGVGWVGSAPDSAQRPYETGTVDAAVYPGSPGSATGADHTDPNVTGVIPSAGAFGNGGGAIVLKADGSLIVQGTISVNGDPGAGSSDGECDSDEFEDPSNDEPIFNEEDPPEIIGYTPVSDDPPYEHTGLHGSGGGAGGGIALQARGTIDLGSATLSAQGGNGGDGVLGAGGGGGGGVIKVLAPDQAGVPADLADFVAAGLNGSIDPNGTGACPGIDAPTVPVDNDGQDDPDVIGDEEGTEQETDGRLVVLDLPSATLLPYGPFWRAGADDATFDAYVAAAAGPGDASLVMCAARLPVSAGPASAGALAGLFNVATPPSAADPCGNGGGSTTVTQLGTPTTFTGVVAPPAAEAIQVIDPATSGYYGLYTTAVRARTPGNDCFDGEPSDAADCAVEPFTGVEWVVGVDAEAPTVTVTAPTDGQAFDEPVVTLDMSTVDQAGLSGVAFVECNVSGDEDDDGDPIFRVCSPAGGDTFELQGGAGENTIVVRGADVAGNVSTVTRTVLLAGEAPAATATLSPAEPASTWYVSPPSIELSSDDPAVVPHPDFPDRPLFAYRFDNGTEQTECITNPCTIPATAVADLADGEHVLHFTAIDKAGARKFDDEDLSTESPMGELEFRLDREAPIVALATVPAADQQIGLDEWFSEQPFAVVSAVDRFGGSGVVVREYELDSGGWTTFDPNVPPPVLADGETEVCVRATDLAGNTSDGLICETVRVDSTAPTLTFTASHGPSASGWYNAAQATPTFTADGVDDHGGVGIGDDAVRVRHDNAGFVDCDAPCVLAPPLATGRHAVHASATDIFDNRSDEVSIGVLVDKQPPRTGALIAPVEADGAAGWRLTEPWVTLASVDPGRPWGTASGSGVAVIRYSLDGLGGPFVDYVDSFQVGPGPHTLCFYAVDVAGNPEDPTASCQQFDVDTADPVTGQVPDRAPDVNGWYTGPVSVTMSATDTSPGSGVDAADVFVSVDGGPFVTVTGPVTLGEGVHDVRAFSVDRAGRVSDMSEGTYQVDLSAPTVTLRTLPPDPAANGWFRRPVHVVVGVSDGTGNSGVATVEYKLDAGDWTLYTEAVLVGQGVHTVSARATDGAGRQRTTSISVKVDLTPPVVKATQADPLLWLRLLGPKTTKLKWEVTENLAGPVRIGVVIYDVTGNVVRRLDGGTHTVTPGVKLSSHTVWDGKNQTITGLVPLGIYYYRVTATDLAGNVAFSGESKPIQIVLSLLGL